MENGCPWTSKDAMMIPYHDTEWGIPLHDDQKLFEFMVLDAFQAGLNWKIVLHKREAFRRAFDDFDANKVAQFDDNRIESLMQDTGIIRNRQKILSTVKNAKCFLAVQKEFGTFDTYIWSFVNHQPIVNTWTELKQMPASAPESDKMSTDLRKRGFSFVGTTICYAFMQAAGMINDHLVTCPRHKELQK